MARILIVDDQDNARGMLAETLLGEGYDVDQAQERRVRLRRWSAENGYDLVITDLRMGDIRRVGGSASARVRASPKTEVIVMTAFGTS